MLDLFGSPAILRGGWAYYNDVDPFICAWARGLVKAGLVPDGEVDERSIRDVQPEDLRGFTQCHFFCGILGWPLALQLAGWPDDREVWTGSCPCQPFSSAGKQGGFDDDRHLWPEFFRLIRQRCPATIIGEQVASPAGLGWLDLVRSDLEGEDYAVGAADLCAAGVRAPHIRQRLWWVAESDGRHASAEGLQRGGQHGQQPSNGRAGELAYTASSGRSEERGRDGSAERARHRPVDDGVLGDAERAELEGQQGQRRDDEPAAERAGAKPGRLGDAGRARGGRDVRAVPGAQGAGSDERGEARRVADESLAAGNAEQLADADGRGPSQGYEAAAPARQGRAAVADGFWDDVEWLACRDGKFRPTRAAKSKILGMANGLLGSLAGVRPDEAAEEGALSPLAHGVPNRVGLLRGFGNAIVPQVAAEFVRAYLDCRP